MKFRNRILLAIWGVVFGLLIIFYFILDSWMRTQVETRFTDELRSDYSVINEINSLREAQDIRACQIIAESPRLKAVVELGDWNTAAQLSEELSRSIASDVFLITDAQGSAITRLLNGVILPSSSTAFPPMPAGIRHSSESSVWQVGNAVYQCASTPLMTGDERIGTLTLGYQVDSVQLASVKTMTNSEVLLVMDSILIASTIPADQSEEIREWIRAESHLHPDVKTESGPEVFIISESRERYVAAFCALNRKASSSQPKISYLLLKPVEREVNAALSPVLDTFIILSLIMLAVTVVIGYVISLGISKPIATLVRGTAEVSRGNYDFPINIRGGGELNFLARKFAEMSQSLKETITQLAVRNRDLENALKRLSETQEELVKSERLAATGKLTAQLSHEINNPIHNVQSCLQTALRRMNAEEPDRELIEVALDEVQRLGKLTRQMLDMYRTSMVQEARTPTSINDVLREVLISSANVLTQNRIVVQTELLEGLPQILGTADKLKQVFLNLIINAKDAMPEGGTLTIGTTRQNGNVRITITDTGIGIPPENVNRIFDAFFTTKSSVSGVGLGLSVTYGIVRQHEGSISVRSAPNQGATFEIIFPVMNIRRAPHHEHPA